MTRTLMLAEEWQTGEMLQVKLVEFRVHINSCALNLLYFKDAGFIHVLSFTRQRQ
jgi:hypothetical protein